jgi:UDP-N-acetylglucosamine 2-epimerase (non-hydrolysing)
MSEPMKKILVVFGTRPEAIKMCPLVIELKRHKELKVIVCVTGQHKEMLKQVLDVFGIEPDIDLSIMKDNQNLVDITSSILQKMQVVLKNIEPDLVLVHGDTTTSFSTSLACFYLNVKIGHVEAGLRTYDIDSPFPEEFNRTAISLVSTMDFAPTNLAKENLLREGKDERNIWVTGNTVIDALKYTVKGEYSSEEIDWIGDSKLIFVTAHRRENIGQPMRQMFRAIKRILNEYEDFKVIYPVHLNPEVRKIANEELNMIDRIHLIEPVDVITCHNLMAKSYLILTDSGGIQEEAPSLHKPVLVMREVTERPEGVKAGTLKLVGTKEETIYESFKELIKDNDLYNKMANSINPYGDGNACERIAKIILDNL